MTWRVARSLDVLRDEINAAAPNRSTASDGSIGDAAHASRSSDHNPWVTNNGVGIVRARDFTHDPQGGLDCNVLAERVRQLALEGHPALGAGAYIIWNRAIASATYGWRWRPYNGSNPHDKHLHVSVSLAAIGYDSTRPWGVMTPPKPQRSPKEIARDAVRPNLNAAMRATKDALAKVARRPKMRFQLQRARAALRRARRINRED